MFGLFSSVLAPYRGWKGEMHAQILTSLTGVGLNSITMHNVCLSWPNGKTVQIDELIIARSGIYVIEVKNYKGWIFGNINNDYWTQCLTTGFRGFSEKYRLYNPIMQNQGHIRCLKNVLSAFHDVPVHSIVVFSNDAVFKDVTYDSSVAYLINMSELRRTLKSIDRDYKDSITVDEILKIRETIAENISSSNSKGHVSYVEEVQNMKRSGEFKQVRCPLCGSYLVVRTVKNGEDAGSQFMGCSSYPKCRYTKPLE